MKSKAFIKRIKSFNVINGLIILLLCFLTLYPLWFVIVASFSDGAALLQGKVSFWPIGATLENYRVLFEYSMIKRAYLNTLLYVTLGIIASMALTVLAAYPLSRPEFKARKIMSFYVAFTMLFNGGIIPTYIVVQGVGLIDTIFGLFLPVALSAFNVIVLRTFIQTVPEEMTEAAKIDGCGYFRILLKVIMPCAFAGMMTILLFYIVGHWNTFMPGILYIVARPELLPMQNILRKIVINEESIGTGISDQNIAKGVRYATVAITVLPVIIVYPFMQKYFQKGMMIGSLKG